MNLPLPANDNFEITRVMVLHPNAPPTIRPAQAEDFIRLAEVIAEQLRRL